MTVFFSLSTISSAKPGFNIISLSSSNPSSKSLLKRSNLIPTELWPLKKVKCAPIFSTSDDISSSGLDSVSFIIVSPVRFDMPAVSAVSARKPPRHTASIVTIGRSWSSINRHCRPFGRENFCMSFLSLFSFLTFWGSSVIGEIVTIDSEASFRYSFATLLNSSFVTASMALKYSFVKLKSPVKNSLRARSRAWSESASREYICSAYIIFFARSSSELSISSLAIFSSSSFKATNALFALPGSATPDIMNTPGSSGV